MDTGYASTGHDEKGHRLCCVKPAPKLIKRTTRRKTFVNRRRGLAERNLPQTTTSTPTATNPRKQKVLTIFVFTVRLSDEPGEHSPVVQTHRGNKDSTQKTLILPSQATCRNRLGCSREPPCTALLAPDDPREVRGAGGRALKGNAIPARRPTESNQPFSRRE